MGKRKKTTLILVVLFTAFILNYISPSTAADRHIIEANAIKNISVQTDKDQQMFKLRVRVLDNPPISVFILDDETFQNWDQGSNTVVAYFGQSEINETATIRGRLGAQGTYQIILDNRGKNQPAEVSLEITGTVPAPSVILGLITFSVIGYSYKTARRKKVE